MFKRFDKPSTGRKGLDEDTISINQTQITFGQKPPFEKVNIEYDRDNFVIRFSEATVGGYKLLKRPNRYYISASDFIKGGYLPWGYYVRTEGWTFRLSQGRMTMVSD